MYGTSSKVSGIIGITSASGAPSAGVRGISTAATGGVGVEAGASGTGSIGLNVGAVYAPATGVNVTTSGGAEMSALILQMAPEQVWQSAQRRRAV